MEWGGDVSAEVVRLGGATLMGTALAFSLIGERCFKPNRVALAGALLLLAGSSALLLATVAPFAQRSGEPLLALALEYLERTRHGPRLMAPLLPAAFALVLFEVIRDTRAAMARRMIHGMLAVTLFAVPALMAAGGHTATGGWEHLGMIAQMLHMACGMGWVALVLSLVPGMMRGEPLADMLGRAGNYAAGLVVALIVTGVFTAWVHGASLPWALQEAYGRLLWLKTAVLVLALTAAGVNRVALRRVARLNAVLLRRMLGFEAALLLAALSLAAWLVRTPPP